MLRSELERRLATFHNHHALEKIEIAQRDPISFHVVVTLKPNIPISVGYIPGWAGAHSQGATLDELRENLREVVTMLLEDGDPRFEAEFIGTQSIAV